jgi:hypothetical protein
MNIVFGVLFVILAGALVFLAVTLFSMRKRLHLLEQRKQQLEKMTMDDVGDILSDQETKLRQIDDEVKTLFSSSKELHARLLNCLQDTSIVRYNPFRETGGDQSFSGAILDKHGNGIVISSYHARSGTRVYAKPIEQGDSRFELTEEEREAIARAGGSYDDSHESARAQQDSKQERAVASSSLSQS